MHNPRENVQDHSKPTTCTAEMHVWTAVRWWMTNG